jgi:hypothetical protein
MRRIIYMVRRNLAALCCVMVFMLFTATVVAQPPVKKYSISKGEMHITLGKSLSDQEIDAFSNQYDLNTLSLKELIRKNFTDSIRTAGWKILINNQEVIVLAKPLFSAEEFNDPAARIKMIDLSGVSSDSLYLNPMNMQVFGYNDFKNQQTFIIKDSLVHFVYKYAKNAQQVLLAGNFTNWQSGAIPMTKTDTGWTSQVKLVPGKYYYKFIEDGNWTTDPDNRNQENDGEGNTNSVYYYPNHVFKLDTFTKAKHVSVAGSFNNWQEGKVRLKKTETGWAIPVYLAEGTYTYRFVVDDYWIHDPGNRDYFPNEFNEVNSVVRIGTPFLFVLPGFSDAKSVYLAGSFNQWRAFELKMSKTNTGWELPYTLGKGNYEFKFLVDGKWVNADSNYIRDNEPGSIFVIEPNYTFRLKNYADAKKVFIAGDFNNWSPNAFPMTKKNGEWELDLHLSKGKHLYKFVVDDNWIIDPGNPLWEQNEFNTGNSLLWIE